MKKILVPTDFSGEADAAFAAASFLAKKNNLALEMIHVGDLPVISDPMGTNLNSLFTTDLIERLEENINSKFKHYIEQYPNLKTTVLWGNTTFNILNYIESESVDLVIMGTKGATGVKEVFVGSNTEKIVRNAPCPVLSVKEKIDLEGPKNIVWGIDTKVNYDSSFVEKLKEFQQLFSGKLFLTFINTPFHFKRSEEALKRLNEIAETHKLENYDIRIVNEVYEEEGLKYTADQLSADFIVLGTHGRRGISHLIFGSLAEDINNHAKRPIWTYRIK